MDIKGMFTSILIGIKNILTLNFADRQTAKDRIEVCNSCPAKHDSRNICTACGCYLPIKTRLKDSTCPMESWKE